MDYEDDSDNIRRPDSVYTNRLLNDDLLDAINNEEDDSIRNIMIMSYEENIRHKEQQNKIASLMAIEKAKTLRDKKIAEDSKIFLKKLKDEELTLKEEEINERRLKIKKLLEWMVRFKSTSKPAGEELKKYDLTWNSLQNYIDSNEPIFLSAYIFLKDNGIRPSLLDVIINDLWDDFEHEKIVSRSGSKNNSNNSNNSYVYDEDY